MLRVGVTGGIGSGKSTVCGIFKFLGAPVFHADQVARELYENNDALRQAVQSHFGADVYTGEKLNREKLGQLVFQDPKKLALLNSLVHPLVFESYEAWCSSHFNAAYTIKEAAIMFESGSYKHLQLVVGVVAETDIRIQRVMARDALPREEILRRMEQQIDQETLISKCDYIIKNNGSESLISQVVELHQRFLDIAKTKSSPPFRQ